MFEERTATPAPMLDTTWESQIDEIATKLVVQGIEAETLAELRELGKSAAAADFPEFARLAEKLATTLAAASAGETGPLLKDGFESLRAAKPPGSETISAPETPTYSSFGEDAELVADFLVEAREHLSQIEGQMLILERDTSAMEVVHAVFRAFHTIKGLAGFLGFGAVQAVSHEVETLLDMARNQKLAIDSSIVDVVLESGDYLLAEMRLIERALGSGATIQSMNNHVLIERIKVLAIRQSLPLQRQVEAATFLEPSFDQIADAASSTLALPDDASREHANLEALPLAPVQAPPYSAEASKQAAQSVPANGHGADPGHPKRVVERPALLPGGPPEVPKGTEPTRGPEPAKAADAGSVRVETAKLDHLMDMVGEMVIAQSLIRHSSVLLNASDSRLIGDLSQLARVTAEVQRATMSMRMVQIGQLFQRIERVIRDLSRKAGKQVVLETSGVDTELDKTVAEELSDPLLHMVRNSVDHGIEASADRLAAGKEATAKIRLAAYHQGGQVVIQITDDGRGLHPEKIRQKAEQKNLISPGAQLTEAEIFQLIFEPGFSTAEAITDVSGRGVGMDVVRRNVEKLRGRIETHSIPGEGTTFFLKLPLTLAIIDGLVVEVGAKRYIIPLSVVRGIFKPVAATVFTVEGREEMVLVREHLMPIVRLNQRLCIEARAVLPVDGLLVVIESESKQFCLLVDDLIGKQEVVIKSLGELFKDVTGVSGCAVLGDGRVGLILDTDGIYRGKRR